MQIKALDVPVFEASISAKNENDLHKQSLDIIRQLHPEWNVEDIEFKTFTNGITNKIFCASHGGEKLVFRVFGNGTEKIIDRKRELENIKLLSDWQLAAPLCARFRNGIVYGFLDGSGLSVEQVREEKIVNMICRKMATMHRIPVEAENAEPFLAKKIEGWLKDFRPSFERPSAQKQFDEYFKANDVNLQEQFKHLRATLPLLNNRLVFCHNDLLIHNILYDEKTEEVHFIDYEYGAVNYQLFDIANHFCEYAGKYTDRNRQSAIWIITGVEDLDYSRCPSDQEKRNFLRTYLEYFHERKPEDLEVEHALRQIPFFEAAAHFFWAIWALLQAQNSSINFDYMDYAVLRHGQYARIMESIPDKH
ncbi:choline/ethanolamine kinase [Aphelenchoides avenae]|nr:choline/ethanolamine kinase [Aphelenchus avenae]